MLIIKIMDWTILITVFKSNSSINYLLFRFRLNNDKTMFDPNSKIISSISFANTRV